MLASDLDERVDIHPSCLGDGRPACGTALLKRADNEAVGVFHVSVDYEPQTVCKSSGINHYRFDVSAKIPGMGKTRAVSEILAENLARLVGYDKKTGESKIPQNFLAKKGVAQATIGRILREEPNSRIQTVAVIARHFDLQPWQMLVEGLDPSAPPLLRVPTGREAEFYRRVQQLAKEMGIEDAA